MKLKYFFIALGTLLLTTSTTLMASIVARDLDLDVDAQAQELRRIAQAREAEDTARALALVAAMEAAENIDVAAEVAPADIPADDDADILADVAAVPAVVGDDREITDGDHHQFGEVSALLRARAHDERLVLEQFQYAGQGLILPLEQHFQYGAESAAPLLGCSVAEAQELEEQIQERKAALEAQQTINPADREQYLQGYMAHAGVTRAFAERVYTAVMG